MKLIVSIAIFLYLFSITALADYYGVTYADYYVNGDSSDTSAYGTDIPGAIGQQLEYAKPTNNLFKGYANLNTNEMKAYLAINNYQENNYSAEGDVQDFLEDNFLITGGNPGDTVNVILAYHLQGTMRVTPQNTSSTEFYGETTVQVRIFGGCLDYPEPDWMNKSLRFYYQNNQYLTEENGLIEDVDYTVSNDTVTVDTVITVTAEMTSGEWQNVVWYLDASGSTVSTHLYPDRQVDIEADFWDTALIGISLAPGYEQYDITRESGIPEPTTLLISFLGLILLKTKQKVLI